MGCSGYLSLLDSLGLLVPNSLLKKPGFFTVSFAPLYVQTGSVCGRLNCREQEAHTTVVWVCLILGDDGDWIWRGSCPNFELDFDLDIGVGTGGRSDSKKPLSWFLRL